MESLTVFQFEPLVEEEIDISAARSSLCEVAKKSRMTAEAFIWTMNSVGKVALGHTRDEDEYLSASCYFSSSSSDRTTPTEARDSGFSEEEEETPILQKKSSYINKISSIVPEPVPQPLMSLPLLPASHLLSRISRPIPHLPPDLPRIPTAEDMVQMALATEDPAFWEAYYEGIQFYPKWYANHNVHF